MTFTSEVGGTSIVLDEDYRPHVCYYRASSDSAACLRYARWDGSEWIIETVDMGDTNAVGGYCSLVLDDQGYSHISYVDYTNGALKYATRRVGARIWYVHPDSVFNSIQAALDSCSADDRVLVAACTYYENLVWPNTQGIGLISESGPDTTIIDGGGAGSVITVIAGADSRTTISGFTIRNGSSWEGGGIYCDSTCSPTITDNTITGNTSAYAGGGIALKEGSSPIITGNTISGNAADTLGGGIAFRQSSPTITGNTITDNTACYGGGIYCDSSSLGTVDSNTVDSNTAEYGGGIACYINSSPTIRDNAITGNTAHSIGGGIDCRTNSSPAIRSNTITGNVSSGYGGGISCWHNSSPSIDSCAISSNNGDGVTCDSASNPAINYNDISHNSGYGVRNMDSTITVDAEEVWWGHESGPYHPMANPGGEGDTVSDYVDFEPWLTQSVGVTETVLPSFPTQVVLLKNSPNPFTVGTTITFRLPANCQANLKIYNLAGQAIKTLVNAETSAGIHTLIWDGTDNSGRKVPSGHYFLRLQAHPYGCATDAGLGRQVYTATRKLSVMK